ncbi:short-chain dehydrogenase reductase [Colletotrichum chrysophilum]|uniref:Short-chain dehydrogenase/reductase 3 n=1 Tax=Colletotrichum chrysophilum TaxID=1836956 RepID=A0AAD9ATD2_9PEZI|nr:short-chain dehydrogenase reductase [Colletotrichum chrysophilum]
MSTLLNLAPSGVTGRIPDLLRFLKISKISKSFSRNGWARYALAILLGWTAVKKASRALGNAALNNYSHDKYDWRRELVLITGGSGDMGDMLVRKLAKNCVKVVSIDIVPPRTPLPSNAYFYQADITKATSIKETADQIRQDHGDPTVLVNNAGVMKISTILDETEEQIRQTFDVNIISNFLLIKEFLPSMIKRNHGHVVTIASMASFVTGVQNVDYSCTKVGALALHEGLAQELRHRYHAPKVRTSIIHPTYVRTALIDRVHSSGKFKALLLEPEHVVHQISKQIMSGRSGQVYVPKQYSRAAGARGWPHWAQEGLRNAQKDVLFHG